MGEGEAALDALTEGVQVVSREWRYVYLNEAAARQGRKPRAELVGKTMMECYPGIERTPLFATLERVMRERRGATIDNEFEYDDGRRAWFELRIEPCPAGVVILSLDVTSSRQALRDLVTPVTRVHRGVLLVPLVGALDSHRAAQVGETLLSRVADDAAKVVILDVSGVPEIDTAVANHLMQVTAMVRLLGAETILSGLSPAVSKAIVQLGVDLSAMKTTNRLERALELALQAVGRAIVDA